MNERLKCKTQDCKTTRKKHRGKVPDSGLGNNYLDMIPKVKATKAKIKKFDYIKLKSLCSAKETISNMKSLPTEWEKIFTSDLYNNGLIFKTYKELIQFNSKKTNNLIKKLAEDLNRHFSKKDIQMANRYKKRCSNSLIVRKTQIKTTVRYHLIPARMAIIRKTRDNNFDKDVEKRDHLYTVGGNVTW
uniref:Uncharacterized protein n=1 Tax=Equus caballus TaxID=9796 RepID=A0A9L0RHU1_HORSE